MFVKLYVYVNILKIVELWEETE